MSPKQKIGEKYRAILEWTKIAQNKTQKPDRR